MGNFTGNEGNESEGSEDAARHSRRSFLVGAAAFGIGGPLLAACSDDEGETTAEGAAGGDLPEATIGYVTPRTGQLAAFGEVDDYVLATIGEALGGNITIIDRDSESDPAVAGEVTQQLINEGAHLILVTSTPDTTIPVAAACAASGVPCLSTMAPWQPHYLNTGGDLAADPPPAANEWNYHFFWGLEDIIANFIGLWDAAGVDKVVGGLWPNDPDGLAWSDAAVGFPPALEAAGYTVVDPGRFELGITDFTAIINQFRDEGVNIVSGVVPPPVFANFQSQAIQQGFEPPVITIAKAALFPSAAESFPAGEGITTEVWWTANHPFTSSLTGQSAADLAAAFEADVAQWTQPLGFAHALFEVAADVLRRAGGTDPAAIQAAMAETSIDTVVGPVDFSSGPVPNFTKTPMVMGQWVAGEEYPLELAVVLNDEFPDVPVDADPSLMSS